MIQDHNVNSVHDDQYINEEAAQSDAPLADGSMSGEQLADAPLTDGSLADAPLSDGALADEPLPSEQLANAPLTDIPLTDEPLPGEQLADASLADAPLADASLTEAQPDGAPDAAEGFVFLPPEGFDAKTFNGPLSSLNNDKLFFLYRENRDIAVRNEIVGRHMYLIDIITRKFINRGVEYEDLCQIASIALIKAVERFDLSKGVKFVSFATPTIVGEIKRYFRDKGSTIRIPRRIYEIYQKVNQAKEYLSQSLSRTPMVSDIAEYLKISEENVLEIIESWNVYNIQSFEQNAFSEDNLELHETIGEDDFEFEKIENRDFIEKSMAKLNESEREFINLRYMNDMTQKQIAAVMNVSQMYISRLEKKIIRKFRMILDK
ncbi:MAG: SigB/SigF/SigG family RNA polymerase sigma factor [Oscillospiraceae bacterium]|nr:SigB/SigF/SigG family RNA polymerase sigma factor [Oscillospiraceae bacterium]